MSTREIKFRAWDKLKHQMIKGGSFMDVSQTPGVDRWVFGMDIFNHPDDVELMQYTGLKDKNGVEIYEGDILRSPSMPDSPVEYQRGSFNGVCGDGSHDEWEAPLWRYTVEVIGNIYENPELLK